MHFKLTRMGPRLPSAFALNAKPFPTSLFGVRAYFRYRFIPRKSEKRYAAAPLQVDGEPAAMAAQTPPSPRSTRSEM